MKKKKIISFIGSNETDNSMTTIGSTQLPNNIIQLGVQANFYDTEKLQYSEYFGLNLKTGENYQIHLGEKRQWEIASDFLPLVSIESITLYKGQICHVAYEVEE